MGIKYSFVDNAVYGPDDVNDIVGCLTGSGLAPFLSKDSYSTSDLNSVTAALTTNGTSLDGCACTVKNSGTAEMCVKVSRGIIFFESGVRLVVDVDGYEVGVSPNTAGCVFAHYNSSLQTADIKFEAELPDDGEYVELARLSASGALVETRRLARSKVGTMGRNATRTVEFVWQSPELYSSGLYICARARGIDTSKYNFAYIVENSPNDNLYGGRCQALFDISTGATLFRVNNWDEFYSSKSISGYFRSTTSTYEGSRYIRIIEGEMCVVVSADAANVNKYGIGSANYVAILS